ncbi:hypothetical protein PG989_007283 [Apiospora arundinis]
MKATQISSFAFATVAALAGTSLARALPNAASSPSITLRVPMSSMLPANSPSVRSPATRSTTLPAARKARSGWSAKSRTAKRRSCSLPPRDVQIDLKKQGLECQVQNPGGRPGSDLEQLCQIPDGLKLIEFYIPLGCRRRSCSGWAAAR